MNYRVPIRGYAGGCSGCGEEGLLVHCYDCKANFCSICNITIHQPVKFKAHRRIAVMATEVVDTLCHVHAEKLKLYCFSESCRHPICILCSTIGTHKSHDHRPIHDVFVAEKEEFKAKLIEEASLIKTLGYVKQEKKRAVELIAYNMNACSDAIREDFLVAHRQLDELEQDAIDALNAHVKERVRPLKADITKISDCVAHSVSKKNSKLLFSSSLNFMTHLADANRQMESTQRSATALLETFRSEDEDCLATDVYVFGRDEGKDIVINNANYLFTSNEEQKQSQVSNSDTSFFKESLFAMSSGSLDDCRSELRM